MYLRTVVEESWVKIEPVAIEIPKMMITLISQCSHIFVDIHEIERHLSPMMILKHGDFLASVQHKTTQCCCVIIYNVPQKSWHCHPAKDCGSKSSLQTNQRYIIETNSHVLEKFLSFCTTA